MSERKALIIGATGLVGSYVLEGLLASKEYAEVRVLSRRPLDRKDPKLQTTVVDFSTLLDLSDEVFKVDDVFASLGTTRGQTPDARTYERIEVDYPVQVAERALAMGAKSYHYVSAVGASASSSLAYAHRKGQAEEKLRALQSKFSQSSVCTYRPSWIKGPRKEHRFLESLAAPFYAGMDALLFGPFKKWHSIHADVIAKAMVRQALNPPPGFYVLEYSEMS